MLSTATGPATGVATPTVHAPTPALAVSRSPPSVLVVSWGSRALPLPCRTWLRGT